MDDDPLTIRLGDLKPTEFIDVHCRACGRGVEFHYGVLQRKYRVPSNVLIFDLQFRLRCKHCRSQGPFRISICEERGRGFGQIPERVIVGAGMPQLRVVKRE